MSDAREESAHGRTDNEPVQIPRHADMGDDTLNRLADELDDAFKAAAANDADSADKLDALMAAFADELPLPVPGTFDVDAALERFYQREDIAQTDEAAHVPSAAMDSISSPRRSRKFSIKYILIAAILLTIALLSSAYGLFPKLNGVTTQSTSETLRYAPENEPVAKITKRPLAEGETRYYDSVQEMMDDFGITAPLFPTWVPERFGEPQIWAKVLKGSLISFTINYMSGDNSLLVTVLEIGSNKPPTVEHFDPEVQLLPLNGIGYQFTSDTKVEKVVWRTDIFDCRVSGTASRDEMLQIISSIYER